MQILSLNNRLIWNKISLLKKIPLLVMGVFLRFNQFAFAASDCEEGTVFCGMPPQDVLKNYVKNKINGIIQSDNLALVILGWISFALQFVGLIAFVGILYAWFLYLTGFVNEDNIVKAKKILTWSVIGLIIIMSSYAIISTILDVSAN